MNSKSLILFSVLLITIWLAWRAPSDNAEIALSQRVQNTNTRLNNKQATEQFVLQNRDIAPSQMDLFGVIKPVEVFKPVTRTVAKSAAPVSPVAPPLPFKLIGRMQVGEGSQVLLNVNDEVTLVAVGDILLGQYKVLTIQNNANRTQIQMLNLPFNQVQTLDASSIN